MNYLAASTKAVLITFNGSIIPAFIMSTYSPERSREGIKFSLSILIQF